MIENYLGNGSLKPKNNEIYSSVQYLLVRLPKTKENEQLITALADWKVNIDQELSLTEYKSETIR